MSYLVNSHRKETFIWPHKQWGIFLHKLFNWKMFYRENKAIISMVGNISFFVSSYQIIHKRNILKWVIKVNPLWTEISFQVQFKTRFLITEIDYLGITSNWKAKNLKLVDFFTENLTPPSKKIWYIISHKWKTNYITILTASKCFLDIWNI